MVVGNGSFLSNTFIGNGGNRDLGVNIVNWLAGDDNLITIQPRGAADSSIDIDQITLYLIAFSFLLVLPLAFMITGVGDLVAPAQDMSRRPWLNALLARRRRRAGRLRLLQAGAGCARRACPAPALKSAEVDVHPDRARGRSADIVLEKKAGRLVHHRAARGARRRAAGAAAARDRRGEVRAPPAGRPICARFELEQPAARMTLDGQVFSFGMVNAVTREQYVMTGDAVYAVQPALRRGAAGRTPADLASRQLFGAGEIPVRIELKEFTVEQRDGKWTLAPAPADELSQDDLVRWVDEWRLASAMRVEPHVGGKTAGRTIKVQLKNGGELHARRALARAGTGARAPRREAAVPLPRRGWRSACSPRPAPPAKSRRRKK